MLSRSYHVIFMADFINLLCKVLLCVCVEGSLQHHIWQSKDIMRNNLNKIFK